MHNDQPRDPWELEDDRPPAWRATIEERAAAFGRDLTRPARWALFTAERFVDAACTLPEIALVREIALAGALTNGVWPDQLDLAIVLRAEGERLQRGAQTLFQMGARIEAAYGIPLALAIFPVSATLEATETLQWATIRLDYVVLWAAYEGFARTRH